MHQASKGARLSGEQFRRNLADSGLCPETEISDALAGAGDDGDDVARRLVAAGKLTPYQVEAVRDRKFSELIIDKYEVLERLGAGGMGTVYKARHRRMKRLVAVKVLPRGANQPETFSQRFLRETEVISALTHPNIVMAHDAGQADVGDFLVMEFVDGRDLASLVREGGPLSVAEAVDTVLQAARGLEYAHGKGVIHRDIKPANLLRDQAGVVKVADLGLARLHGTQGTSGDSGLTQVGGIVGTVDYMPPEQAFDSSTTDHRADIYSLGCTLHYLLTGQPPYRGETVMATLLRHSSASIPSLAAARPDVPPELEAVFRKMMAKTPAERYQNMADLVRALEGLRLDRSAPQASLAGGARPADNDTSIMAPGRQTLAGTDTGATVDLRSVSPPTAGGVVLLVEPSRTQANIIRKYLEDLGTASVLVAPTGQKALELMRAAAPRAVVCAMHLDDMTGGQLLRQVRDVPGLAEVGFVVITASQSDSMDLRFLRGAPRTALLPKPFDRDKLRLALLAATAGPPAEPRYAELRVLLVDDSAPARAHLGAVLSGLGFRQVREAADGTEAVALLTREKFDLVVTDYNMPLMDGRALIGFIRQHSASPQVPILMCTTETDPGKLQAVRQLGVSEVCEKSFQPEVVRGILERLLQR